MVSSVPGTMQEGVGGKLHAVHSVNRLRLDLCRVAEVLPGDCLTLKGFVGSKRGTRVQAGRRCLPLVTEPFMSRRLALSFRGELLVCDRSCCANISCLVAPAAIVHVSAPLLVSHPV